MYSVYVVCTVFATGAGGGGGGAGGKQKYSNKISHGINFLVSLALADWLIDCGTAHAGIRWQQSPNIAAPNFFKLFFN